MKPKSSRTKAPADQVVRHIRRTSRWHFCAEDKKNRRFACVFRLRSDCALNQKPLYDPTIYRGSGHGAVW